MANVIEGGISRENNEILFQDGEGLKISMAKDQDEGRRTIIFRPQNVALCKQGGDFQGVVKLREFLGNIVRYEILVGNKHLIVDEVYGKDRSPTEVGAEVELKLDKDYILVMG